MLDKRLRLLLIRLVFPLILGLIIVLLTSINLMGFDPKQVTLNILLPAIQAPYWRELIKDFEKNNLNIKIIMNEVADQTNLAQDIYKKQDTSENKRSLKYDLVYTDIIWVPEFANKNLLVNLKEAKYKFLEDLKELKVDFLQKDWEGGVYKNGLYRIPFHSDVGVLFYRKDLLEKVGKRPPETFDDLMKISKELQEKYSNLRGYVWQGQQYEGLVAMFVEVLKGYGGFWINENHEVGLDKDQAFKAVKFLRDTIENKISPPGVTTFTERETTSTLKKGEAVFVRNWVFWDEINGPGSEIQDKYDFVPMVHEGNNKSGSCQGGWGLGISSKSEHPEEAWKAIKFFTSFATQKKYALKTGNMPSRRSLLNDLQLVKRYSYYPKLLKISQQNLVLRPSIPNYREVSKILQKYLSDILKNKNITQEGIQKNMKEAAKKTRIELLQKSH